jgi:hypothetical protein
MAAPGQISMALDSLRQDPERERSQGGQNVTLVVPERPPSFTEIQAGQAGAWRRPPEAVDLSLRDCSDVAVLGGVQRGGWRSRQGRAAAGAAPQAFSTGLPWLVPAARTGPGHWRVSWVSETSGVGTGARKLHSADVDVLQFVDERLPAPASVPGSVDEKKGHCSCHALMTTIVAATIRMLQPVCRIPDEFRGFRKP